MFKIDFRKWPKQQGSWGFEFLLIIGKHSRRLSIRYWPFLYEDDKVHIGWVKYDPGLGFSDTEAIELLTK